MNRYLAVVLIVLLSKPSQAQLPVPPDTIFNFIKGHSIHRNTVNWSNVYDSFRERLFAAKTTKDTMKSLVYVFEQLNDVHSQMFLDNQYYGHYKVYDDSVLKNLNPIINRSKEQNGTIITAFLKNKYVYVLVPGIFAQGNAINEYAQIISDSICRYNKQQVKGFIIDLRLNSGGQLSSMIGGLNLLLGNNYLGGSVDVSNTETRKFELKNNNFYIGNAQTTSIVNKCKYDHSKTPVVVLIGPATVSSGSITAIAFKQRANTYFIGEPTADGYTTGNNYFFFGNNFMLNLATEFNQDRLHNIYKNSVLPDKLIKAGDNFDNLSNDEKIKAALLWLAKANPLK
ncbi:MAG: S41 family peptidase [Ferruginibacter sp.]